MVKRLSSTNQNNNSLINVPDGVNPQDAVNKRQLDAKVNRSEIFRNIRDFGAVGDGTTDDTIAIISALGSGNVNVLVPPGTYYVTEPMTIYSNTYVLCQAGAVFKVEGARDNPYTFLNGEYGDANYATEYNGESNIIFEGGRITFTPTGNSTRRQQAFGMSHGRNIWIKNVEIDGWYRAHAIEYNAVADSGIVGCRMINQVRTDGTDTNREAIQIDSAHVNRFNAFGATDGTPCVNILIENNYIDNAEAGIGNHSGDETRHDNIRILNNVVKFTYSFGIRTRWFYNSIVSGNYIENVQYHGLRIHQSPGCIIKGNQVIDIGLAGETAVYIESSNGCVFDKTNHVDNKNSLPNYTYAITVGPQSSPSTSCIVDTDNCFPGSEGYILNETPDLVLDGAHEISLANNTATSIPIKMYPHQGLLAVSTASNSARAVRGLYWVRTVTPGVHTVAEIPGASTTQTTGALNGTTGPSGHTTISAFDRRFYIENRTGGNMTYTARYLS